MRIAVLGADFEGLTISVGLASKGHSVTAVDADRNRIRKLQRGQADDVDLSRQMKLVIREGLLKFAAEAETGLTETDVVFITSVPANSSQNMPVLQAAECLSGSAVSFSTVIVTASVAEGSCRALQNWLNTALYAGAVNVVAFPLSLPNGIKDLFNPGRIVLGYEQEESRRVMDELLADVLPEETSVSHVSWEDAENLYLK